MLFGLILFFLFALKIPLCLAQDHQAWAVRHQEQSQELIKSYGKEALDFKNQAPSLFKGKGCSSRNTISCLKQQELKQPSEANQGLAGSHLYIFISLSMPKESLKALARETKKHKSVLVIRGLIDNSFLKTATFLKELGEGVVLDPLLFREYNVVVVPTFIAAYQAGYKKISGNITLAYALSKFKEGVA